MSSSCNTPTIPFFAPYTLSTLDETTAQSNAPTILEFITAVGPPDWAKITFFFSFDIHDTPSLVF